ncbi:MAG: hypothetical protein LBK06_04530 [Planctomycetaceae bacterium]|jgi:hypothetical protein|nr:hypothetical protein [Planctomycetaceae bacterium]
MGAFYYSFNVHQKTQQEVIDLVTTLQKERQDIEEQNNFIVGNEQNGWVSVYTDDLLGMDIGLAGAIASKLQTRVILIDVHDDDVFTYYYFRDGEMVDSFNSCPDYFGTAGMDFNPDKFTTISPEELEGLSQKIKTDFNISGCKDRDEAIEKAKQLHDFFEQVGFIKNKAATQDQQEEEKISSEEALGNPECFAELVNDPDVITKLSAIMESMRKQDWCFISELALEFCDLLGLPDALNSYRYLLEEELPTGYVHVMKNK